jgi:VIT1/CCC1 family predicted Fe2+/Mn2+ transporter
MKGLSHSWSVGVSFGVTSGVITTIGLLVGLSAGTNSKPAVVAGILTIAVADSLSDALGIHIAEESEGIHTRREIWSATVATFAAKLTMAMTFLIPVFLFPLDTAVVVAIVWGAVVLAALSFAAGRRQGVNPTPIVLEHLTVAAVVVAAAHLLGVAVSALYR